MFLLSFGTCALVVRVTAISVIRLLLLIIIICAFVSRRNVVTSEAAPVTV